MSRNAQIERKTKETQISVTLNIDGTGQADINTGIGFLDHMLEQLARHSFMDITLKARAIYISMITTLPKIQDGRSAQPWTRLLTSVRELTAMRTAVCLWMNVSAEWFWMCLADHF